MNLEWNLKLLKDPHCYIAMPTLIDKLGLVYQDQILAKVIAVNERGSSLLSSPNTVAPIVEDVPRQMQPCT